MPLPLPGLVGRGGEVGVPPDLSHAGKNAMFPTKASFEDVRLPPPSEEAETRSGSGNVGSTADSSYASAVDSPIGDCDIVDVRDGNGNGGREGWVFSAAAAAASVQLPCGFGAEGVGAGGVGGGCIESFGINNYYFSFSFFLFLYFYNDGLVQPIANWAKHRESIRRDICSPSEVGGKRYDRLPGQRGVIAPARTVHEPSLRFSFSAPPDHEITILPTARVLYLSRSLSLAFFISRVLYLSRS